jgi:hypothetical protein
VKRLVLAHQLIALRLHILDFIVILGKGTIKLRLEHGGVLPGLGDFFIQCFRPEHRIAISLEHLRFLMGSLHDILQQTVIVNLGTQHLSQFNCSRVLITYLHPLLGPAHRLQVARYSRWVDEIVHQKLDPTTTSRGGLGHWRRTDWLCILNLRQPDDYFQA